MSRELSNLAIHTRRALVTEKVEVSNLTEDLIQLDRNRILMCGMRRLKKRDEKYFQMAYNVRLCLLMQGLQCFFKSLFDCEMRCF